MACVIKTFPEKLANVNSLVNQARKNWFALLVNFGLLNELAKISELSRGNLILL